MTGNSFEEWIGNIFSGMSQGFALFALVESGCLEYLAASAPQAFTANEIAEKLSLDPRILSGILHAIGLSESGVLEFSAPNKFKIGPNAEWALRDGARGLNQIFIGGYADVLGNLFDLLKKNKTYNNQVTRNSKWVGEGTFTFTKVVAPYIAAEIKKTTQPSVLDLGCGTGRLLLYYSKEIPGLNCAGIDISESSISLAKALASEVPAEERPEYFCGDVFKLNEIPNLKGRKINILSAQFIFHEFLYEKNNRLPALLKSLKENFPGAGLICTEFNALSPEAYGHIQPEKRMPMLTYHHLIHSVTDQGMPMSVESWSDYFISHGVTVEKVKTLRERQISIYFLRL